MPETSFAAGNQIALAEIDQDSPITEGLFSKIKNRDIEVMDRALKAVLFGGDGSIGAVTVNVNTTWDSLKATYNLTDDILNCETFTINSGVTLASGYFDQSGDMTSGSAVITNLSDTSKMSVNMRVTGSNITHAFISSIDSAAQITLNRTAAVTAAGVTLTFCKQEKIIILAAQGITINGSLSANGAGGRGALPRNSGNADGLNGEDGYEGGGGGSGGGSTYLGGTGGAGAGSTSKTIPGHFVWKAASITSIPLPKGGGGGGSGAQLSAAAPNNYGGNGGGIIYLESPYITIGSTAVIEANGDAGADGNNITSDDGGGGGGGGGVVMMKAVTHSYNASAVMTVNGGTGQIATGAGADGGAGGSGSIMIETVFK